MFSEDVVATAAIVATVAAAVVAAIVKIVAATVAGKAVKNSRDYGRGRRLPYYRGNGIAVRYDRRFARIIGYGRSV